jgi:hypothetical protein
MADLPFCFRINNHPRALRHCWEEVVLQRVEHETGVEGRRAFEGFLKKMHKTKEEQSG